MAEKLSSDVPDTLQKMNRSMSSMEGISSGVSAQIGDLQEYIRKLQKQIQSYYMELAGI